MKTANGFVMLDIAANILGMAQVIHPAVIWDQEAVILGPAISRGYGESRRTV